MLREGGWCDEGRIRGDRYAGIESNMAGCEGNHVVERICFHSCGYNWNHHSYNILRDVAGIAAGGLQGWLSIVGRGW